MAEAGITLRDYWRIVRRRRWVLAATTLTVLASTYIATKRMTPVYIASTDLKVQRASAARGFLSDYVIWGNVDFIGTETMVIRSWPVLHESCQQMGWITAAMAEKDTLSIVREASKRLEIEKTGYTNILRIAFSGPDPVACARFVNIVAAVYRDRAVRDRNRDIERLKEHLSRQIAEAERDLIGKEQDYRAFLTKSPPASAREAQASNLAALRTEREKLLKQYQPQHPRVAKLDDEIQAIEGEARASPRDEVEEARLKREIAAASGRLNAITVKYQEGTIMETSVTGTTEVISPAQPPRDPVRPVMKLNLMIGGFAGLFLGFIGALLLEQLDTSISDIEEVESFLQMPVLGLVPRIGGDVLVTIRDPKSTPAEAFRTLLVNLRFVASREQPLRLVVTSAGVDEGKTVTAANLAVVLAEGGRRTVLVEGDMRRPTFSRILDVRRTPGLSEVLLGDVSLDEALLAGPIPGLSVLPSGRVPPNPMDLLSRPGLERVIQALTGRFDVVVVDSPPVLPVADGLVLSALADGVVLVYKVGATSRGALKRATSLLAQARAHMFGVVLNDVRTQLTADYDFLKYYRYYGRSSRSPGVVARGRELLRRWHR